MLMKYLGWSGCGHDMWPVWTATDGPQICIMCKKSAYSDVWGTSREAEADQDLGDKMRFSIFQERGLGSGLLEETGTVQ